MGFQTDTHVVIVVLASLQLAPNTYLGDGLPADSLAGIINDNLTAAG